jgi:hypothetical protein
MDSSGRTETAFVIKSPLEMTTFMTDALSRRRFLQWGALTSGAVLLDYPAFAQPRERRKAAKTVRLLTIGNSFSGDATRLLDEIVAAAGHTLVYRTCSIGGGSMAQHWEKARLHDKDPKDPNGLYGTKRSLREELTAEKWDFVTIQQASILSHNPATYRPYAAQLYGYVRALAPQAEVLVHQTWAYRLDDPRFSPTAPPKPGDPKTQREMYEMLTQAYNGIAAELGGAGGPLRIIPVGDAYFKADMDPTWGYKTDTVFDRKTAKSPDLPNQTHSLHIGWRWKAPTNNPTGPVALAMDGHHSDAPGQYMGACAFFEMLYGESAVGNSFIPKAVAPDYARFLQQTAHDAVQARLAAAPEPVKKG